MTVAQLKKLLVQFPDDLKVILSKDGEGNEFSPFDGHSIGYYFKESSYSGTFIYEEDLAEAEEEFGLEVDEGEKVICLWPVN
jgi:hypothetical protein